MKLYKIFAIALLALSMSACSDDDNDFNTADVTVEMQEATMKVSEDISAGVYYNVPIQVIGEANGSISVTVEIEAQGENAATEETHYVITSKSIVIPADKKVGYIEFHTIGDTEINADREFTVKIASASGAKVGANNVTKVILLDNERLIPEAYAAVIGTWTWTSSLGTWPVTFEGYAEDEEGYGTKLIMRGFADESITMAEVGFELDASTGEINLTFTYGQTIAAGIEFTGLGVADVLLCGFDGSGLYLNGANSAKSNPEKTVFEFAEGFAGAIFIGGSFSGYAWWTETGITMTKAN